MRLETAEELINFIKNSQKKTLTKAYINGIVDFKNENIFVFKGEEGSILIGDWKDIEEVIEKNKKSIINYFVENIARNSGVPLLDTKNINARIEPGAIIRDKVKIGDNAVIMMGAVINIGAEIGEGTMIDMNVVLGGRAIVGKRCHIGAGTVLAGVIEPPSAQPVVIEDDVMIGANAVVIEGVRVGKGACMTNRAPLAAVLEQYIASLNGTLEKLKAGDNQYLSRLFETSRDYRNSISERNQGSVTPEYSFTVDMADEVGAISTLSVILAAKGISIKNIGINHNREHGEGTLKIIFYDKEAMDMAWKQLERYHYDLVRV